MNDVIIDCCVDIFGKKPTNKMIKFIKDCQSPSIHIASDEWRADDTLVRKEIKEWISKNIKSMEDLRRLSK